MAKVENRLPLSLSVWLGDARVFVDTRDRHGEIKLGLALTGSADNGRRRRRHSGARQRNMALSSEQTGRRIKADPTGTGNEHFGPGMQIGEVVSRARRAVKRLDVRLELNQIARRKARGQPKVTHDLHQQPGRITTRPELQLQRLLRRLHAGFHAHHVVDVVLEALVDADQHVDGTQLFIDRRAQELFLRAGKPLR